MQRTHTISRMNDKPYIRLLNKKLISFGFNAGDKIVVQYSNNQITIIKKGGQIER